MTHGPSGRMGQNGRLGAGAGARNRPMGKSGANMWEPLPSDCSLACHGNWGGRMGRRPVHRRPQDHGNGAGANLRTWRNHMGQPAVRAQSGMPRNRRPRHGMPGMRTFQKQVRPGARTSAWNGPHMKPCMPAPLNGMGSLPIMAIMHGIHTAGAGRLACSRQPDAIQSPTERMHCSKSGPCLMPMCYGGLPASTWEPLDAPAWGHLPPGMWRERMS